MRPRRALTVFAAVLLPALAHADFAECILEKVSGVQNDAAAGAAYQVCLSKFPGGLTSVKQGSGRGLFGYDSGAECTLDRAGKTGSQRAATMINAACRKLYDEPNFFDQFDQPPR